MIGVYHTIGMLKLEMPASAITMVRTVPGMSEPIRYSTPSYEMIVITKCDECKALVDERDHLEHADSHMKDRGFR